MTTDTRTTHSPDLTSARHAGSAELLAAIRAAADTAPLEPDACELMPKQHGPERPQSRCAFHYLTPDGARGCYTVPNIRARLLNLAANVKRAAAAFDGKPKRAPAPRKAPAASPAGLARDLLRAGQRAEALQAAESMGAVFFGAGAVPVLYTRASVHELAGDAWIIARCVDTGRLRILHQRSGLAADCVRELAAPRTMSDCLAYLETAMTDDAAAEYRGKMRAAAARAADYHQDAARVAFLAADGATGDSAKALAAQAYALHMAELRAPAPDTLAEPLEPAASLARVHDRTAELAARIAAERSPAAWSYASTALHALRCRGSFRLRDAQTLRDWTATELRAQRAQARASRDAAALAWLESIATASPAEPQAADTPAQAEAPPDRAAELAARILAHPCAGGPMPARVVAAEARRLRAAADTMAQRGAPGIASRYRGAAAILEQLAAAPGAQASRASRAEPAAGIAPRLTHRTPPDPRGARPGASHRGRWPRPARAGAPRLTHPRGANSCRPPDPWARRTWRALATGPPAQLTCTPPDPPTMHPA